MDDPARRRLPVLLRRAWYGLNQVFRRRVAVLGVTPDQCSILRWLAEAPPPGLTQRQLSVLMCSDPNTIAALVARMARQGLVARHRHEQDARCNLLRLTGRGRALYRRVRPVAQQWQAEALSVLPTAQREVFLRNLDLLGQTTQTELARSKATSTQRRAAV